MLSEITIKILLTPEARISVEGEGALIQNEIPPPPMPVAEGNLPDLPGGPVSGLFDPESILPPEELEEFEGEIPPVPEE